MKFASFEERASNKYYLIQTNGRGKRRRRRRRRRELQIVDEACIFLKKSNCK
jgi:hypothetical protein